MKKKKNMKNMHFISLHIYTYIQIYNSGYSTDIVNEQCSTGDPLETSGGLYRGPPSMLIYVNTIKCCACETLKLKCGQYPAIHTNYSCSNCTISVVAKFPAAAALAEAPLRSTI